MSKLFKKILSFGTVCAMALSLSVPAFAASFATTECDAYFANYAEDFEAYADKASQNRAFTLPEEIVQDFIEAEGQNYDIETLMRSTEEHTIFLDEENTITLDGIMIYVNGEIDVEATPDRIAKGAVDVSTNTRAARSTTSIKSYYHAVYALLLGQEIYRITQEAQFTYNGSSVSVNYADGYYERGFLSIWQVSDFQDSEESTYNGSARVKSSANFHYGLEINGIGLVIQDNNCWVDARCTKNGSVSGYCDGEHKDPIFDIL